MADTFTDCLYGTCPACEAAGHGLWRLRADRSGTRLYCIFTDCPLSGEDFSFEEIDAMQGKSLEEIIRATRKESLQVADDTAERERAAERDIEDPPEPFAVSVARAWAEKQVAKGRR